MVFNPLSGRISRIISVIAMGVGSALLVLVLGRYQALSSNFFDLGIFLNSHFNLVPEWQRAFYGHMQPLMLIWGPIYHTLSVAWAPLALVGAQALVLLGSVVAIWRVFGTWPGLAMLLYYPLWVNALFDFHFDHLAIPLLAAYFIGCERQRYAMATLAAALLVLVKEPFALQTLACGLYFGWLAISPRHRGYHRRLIILAMLLVVWGAVWFYGVTHWVLPYFTDGMRGGLDAGAFSWLGKSLTEIMWTMASRPGWILSEILGTPGKLVYLAVIFGLLAFIPLLRPAALIVALPLLAIAMLSRLDNYYDYATHYTAGVIVPVIVAFRDGSPVARRWFVGFWLWLERVIDPSGRSQGYARGLAGSFKPWAPDKVFSVLLASWLVAGHWALASSPISRLFWSDKVWSYSWRAYVPDERTAMIKGALLTYVPADPAVAVTTQNSLNWGHLAHRQVYLPFPLGVVEPHAVMDWSNRNVAGLWRYIRTGERPPAIFHERYADYVVLDLKRPYFMVDKGCQWIFGVCQDFAMERVFLEAVALARDNYDTLFEEDGFLILRRRMVEQAAGS